MRTGTGIGALAVALAMATGADLLGSAAMAAPESEPDVPVIRRDATFMVNDRVGGGSAAHVYPFGRAGDKALVCDWNGNGIRTAGVVRGNTWMLRNEHRGGAADLVFNYGRSDDVPVCGDWNGDGVETPGIVRTSDGGGPWFHLRDTNRGGTADRSFAYGAPGDLPVVGDWNGDGRTTVGVVRRTNGSLRWLLRNRTSGGPANLDYTYARSDDRPVVGDWNGDGSTTVGVVRRGRWLLRDLHRGGAADHDFRFGRADDRPITTSWLVLREVVSSFTTPLEPGQSRNTNIHRAANLIHGTVIRPGQRFSLDDAIGDRTRERGFVPNGYIDGDGNVRSTVGGGVSQVAVTFLNTAWFAGIDILEFRPHSVYFERYPMCREATLDRHRLDVVVVNDSPHDLTVLTDHSDRHVTVRFVSVPWARVSSWTSDPYNVRDGAFTVDCGRTVTYPDGSRYGESHRWRYSDGYPG